MFKDGSGRDVQIWIFVAVLIGVALGTAGFFVILLLWSRRIERRKRQEELEQQRLRQLEAEQLPLSERMLRLFRQQYRETSGLVRFPQQVGTARIRSDVFCLRDVFLDHRIWLEGEALHLFPLWEGFEQALGSMQDWPAICREGDEFRLYHTALPVRRIGSYQRQDGQDGLTILRYRDPSGEVAELQMGREGYEVLRKLLPKKDKRYILARVYPHTAQHINDVTRQLEGLRRQMLEGEISQTEYDNRKAQVLVEL